MTNFNCGTDNFGEIPTGGGEVIHGGYFALVHAVPPGGGRPACSEDGETAEMQDLEIPWPPQSGWYAHGKCLSKTGHKPSGSTEAEQ
jgi:hypothetical protein